MIIARESYRTAELSWRKVCVEVRENVWVGDRGSRTFSSSRYRTIARLTWNLKMYVWMHETVQIIDS